ncbi:MAG: endonuclease MutS2, partial [Terriglobales bacterium]
MPAPSDAALAPGVAAPDAAAILALVARYVATPMGRRELAGLRFQRDTEALSRARQLHAECNAWVAAGGPQLGGVSDPGALLERAGAPEAALEGGELLEVLAFLDVATELRRQLESEAAASRWPALAGIAAGIPEWDELRAWLHRALLPGGEVADEASPRLAELRRRIARQRQALEAALARQMRQLAGEGVLQDEIITVRNERLVLAVRSEHRRRSPGVVHGASSTGQTLFVEPLETVELNNEHIELLEREQAEVNRILAELTAAVAAAGEGIAAAAEACGALDWEAAKVRFARDFGATSAEPGAALELEAARHPLLLEAAKRGEIGRAVPLTLRLGCEGEDGRGARALVISGPNTGGKTVVLKTVAAAAWMAQCGLPVCARRAALPIFDAIWADIGDEQSIEQNLSTFSSHLVQLRRILEAATADSLVLLDELGTATSAAEGAALAVEIASHLAERGVWTLISTHHDALKAWTSAHAEVAMNASLAMDPETLAPSYEFQPGVPGVSAGLDMAARLGLPAALVAGARRRLSEEEREAAHYAARLQQELLAVGLERAGLGARELEVRAREQALAGQDERRVEKAVAALRQEMERRLEGFLAGAEKRWSAALAAQADELTTAQKRKQGLELKRLKRETSEALAREAGAVLGGK